MSYPIKSLLQFSGSWNVKNNAQGNAKVLKQETKVQELFQKYDSEIQALPKEVKIEFELNHPSHESVMNHLVFKYEKTSGKWLPFLSGRKTEMILYHLQGAANRFDFLLPSFEKYLKEHIEIIQEKNTSLFQKWFQQLGLK